MLGVRRIKWLMLFLAGAIAAPTGAALAVSGPPDFSAIVTRTAPVVVNISTSQRLNTLTQNIGPPPADGDQSDPYADWYRHFFGTAPQDDGGGEGDNAIAESLGSGFIISADGEILTNYHVIENAERITVKLNDRRELPAKVLGVDPPSDLALLKIGVSGLPIAVIGDAGKLKVGQWVLAIGSPFGFDHSVTAGIVSAQGRSIGSEQYVPYIQTDVPINPGNSGGPLFNLDGQVVGINSEIYSRTGGYQGVSFAIPINLAMEVVRQLRTHGRVIRGWLGVNIVDVLPDMVTTLHLTRPEGALVRRVFPASPASQAGLKTGDVILAYNGAEVVNSQALPPLVGSTPVGNDVSITVLRQGARHNLKIRIAALPVGADVEPVELGGGEESGFDALGLALRSLTGAERRRLDLASDGILVDHVADGSGRRAGLRPGDVLLSLNGIAVTSPRQFVHLEQQLPADRPVPLLVRRQGNNLFLPLKAGGG